MSDELEQILRGLPERRRLPRTFRLGGTVRVEIFGRGHALKLGYDELEAVSFK